MNILKYTKAVVAGVAAVLIVVSAAATGSVVDPQAIIAVVSALGVFALPNKESNAS